MNVVNKLSLTEIALIVIVFAGFGLRFWQLSTTPLVNRDELAIGYNAYSVLETGKDEHGYYLPVSFKSFGDYKLPGLIYSTVLPLFLFGQSLFSVRFTTALFGSLTIIIAFWFLKQLRFSDRIALCCAGLLAISPWHLLGSRSAYEPVAGLFWSLLSYGFLVKSRSSFSNVIGFLLCTIMSTLFYNAAVILAPTVYCLFLFSLYLTKDRLHAKHWIVFGILLTYLSCYWVTLQTINASRLNTTVFNIPTFKKNAFTVSRSIAKDGYPSFFVRLSQLPYRTQIIQILKGYTASFDPLFLWFTGGNNPWHNLSSIGYGNLYLYTLPFFLGGLLYLFMRIKEKSFEILFTFALLFTTPLASAITIDAPNINRLFDFHFMVTAITAIGFCWAVSVVPQLWKITIVGLCSISSILFLVFFFSVLKDDTHPLWNASLSQVLPFLQRVQKNYPIVHTVSPAEYSYIYYAFYTPFPPADFQKYAVWSTVGMEQVTAYRTYRFESFSPLSCNKILEVSPAALGESEEQSVSIIKNRFGEPVWKIWENQL